MAWARFAPNSYECSSAGDKRFSALFAVLPDGRTIEEAYQLDVKGYRSLTDDWRFAKGKPALVEKTHDELFSEYLALWEEWAAYNQDLIDELVQIVQGGKVLTDKFASTKINQAHALSVIADNRIKNSSLPFQF